MASIRGADQGFIRLDAFYKPSYCRRIQWMDFLQAIRLRLLFLTCAFGLGLVLQLNCRANEVPHISLVPDQTIPANKLTSFLPLVIGDAETPATNLVLAGFSANTDLVANSGISFAGSSSNRFVRVRPLTNQIGSATIEVRVTDGAGDFASSYFLLTVTNGPPQISIIPNRMVNAGITSPPIAFIITDTENSPSDLVVTASSQNQTLLASSNIFLSGTSSNRSLRVLPALALGNVNVTLSITDYFGASVVSNFNLTLSNSPPVITNLYRAALAMNATNLAHSFNVRDLESPADSLVLSAFSMTPTLLPDQNIVFGGSGSNRTVTIWPAPDQKGTGVVSLVLTDTLGASSTNLSILGILQFVEVPNPMPGLWYSSAEWGDFDNDGLLDVALIGMTPGLVSQAHLFRNTGSGSFSNMLAGLPGFSAGAIAWGDYDNDGNLDLAVSGNGLTRIYRNTGSGVFTDTQAGLLGLFSSALAWGDYDNDGDLDLVLSGWVGGVRQTKLYRNHGQQFQEVGVSLPACSHGSLAWGDYDNDQDLDLLIAGINDSYQRLTRVYRNDGQGSFTMLPPLRNRAEGSVAWGDYDNDNDLDILITGGDGSSAGGSVYRNDGGDLFVEIQSDLPAEVVGGRWADYDNDGDLDIVSGREGGAFDPLSAVYQNQGGFFSRTWDTIYGLHTGSIAWGDYDQDGRLDLLHTGMASEAGVGIYATKLYRNHATVANSAPSAPSNLSSVVSGPTVLLSWSPGTDANQSGGLTYNLRVGTNPGGSQVVTPMSATDGTRRLPALGNVLHNRGWRLHDLLPGTYYWSVQTIDHGSTGSAFATEESFVIPAASGSPSAITQGAIEVTCTDMVLRGLSNPNGLATIAWFEYGLTTNYGNSTPRQSLGDGNNELSFQSKLSNLAAATAYWVRAVAANATGTNQGQNRLIMTQAFTPFSVLNAGFPEQTATNVRLVDYDNDGDMDAQVDGRMFRNTANHFADTGLNLLLHVCDDYNRDNKPDFLDTRWLDENNGDGTFTRKTLGSAVGTPAWGDFDGDGDLDLAVASAPSAVFRNTGNDVFTNLNAGFPTALYEPPAWFDYNNDGWLDLFLPNVQYQSRHIYLYRNDSGQGFVDSGLTLPGVFGSGVDWCDYDSDGDLDLLVGDESGPGYPLLTRIFLNTGSGNFADSGITNLPFSSKLAWGDFDNDGDPDILTVGRKSDFSYEARVICNDAGEFTNNAIVIEGARAVAWGDYDQDGDLDVLASGVANGSLAFIRIYRNNCLIANVPPPAPQGLQCLTSNQLTILSWNGVTEVGQTNGFSYNLRIGSSSGGTDILSPLADTSSGLRRQSRFGNAGIGPKWMLQNLPSGNYYWSVQAIDHGLAGSAFSAEARFSIGLVITEIHRASNNICHVSFNAPTAGSYTLQASPDLVSWSNANSLNAPTNGIFTLTEAGVPNVSPRFFRIRSP